MKITHVITGLSTGGAETMLYKLLSRIDRQRFTSEVISLTGRGEYAEKIEALGIPVRDLGEGGLLAPRRAFALRSALSRSRPDLIQTWMYHADLLGGLAAKALRGIPVIWNVRASRLEEGIKRSTLLTVRLCALTSRWLPEHIVCGSEAARIEHTRLGYAADRMTVIPNGFDLEAFHPDEAARLSLRDELALAPDTLLIGLIARFDPLKDHATFIAAAKLLSEQEPDVHFVLSGEGVTAANSRLFDDVTRSGLADRVHLLGRRTDVPLITAALDIATLTSFSEGFPNVVGEAMASAVPVVTTDVGDAALMVGDTGIIVTPRSPREIAGAWRALIREGRAGRQQRGLQARERVRSLFSLDAIVGRYETLYSSTLAGLERGSA